VAALVGGRAVVRVLGSASLRADAGVLRGRRPGWKGREALEAGSLRLDATGVGGGAWLR